MPMSEQEQLGIVDLFVTQNETILLQLARSVTKYVCNIDSVQEALQYLFTHIEDATTLLSKRLVTKELLFKYLHRKNVLVTGNFTKQSLISKVLDHWTTHLSATDSGATTRLTNSNISSFDSDETTAATATAAADASSALDVDEANYPIHQLARKFTEWFFKKLNDAKLSEADLWPDACLQFRLIGENAENVRTEQYHSAASVVGALLRARSESGFYFNPNLTHDGVQGRMDVHGLVLVLNCGTLHTESSCVGVFESTFGLLRDPFAENNWKTKTMQCTLRCNAEAATSVLTPILRDSDTLQLALQLPAPMAIDEDME